MSLPADPSLLVGTDSRAEILLNELASAPSALVQVEMESSNPAGGFRAQRRMGWFRRWLSTCGPWLVVMLADTDAGCLVTTAQTGATWGYSLLWLQLLLIGVLIMAQELTARCSCPFHPFALSLVRVCFDW